MTWKNLISLCTLIVVSMSVVVAGCGKGADTGASATATVQRRGQPRGLVVQRSWCSRRNLRSCSIKIAADFKAKGDWCKKHDRPESQCFVCHPDKEAEFAALYEAKYGTKPPKIEVDGGQEKPQS